MTQDTAESLPVPIEEALQNLSVLLKAKPAMRGCSKEYIRNVAARKLTSLILQARLRYAAFIPSDRLHERELLRSPHTSLEFKRRLREDAEQAAAAAQAKVRSELISFFIKNGIPRAAESIVDVLVIAAREEQLKPTP